MIGVAIIGEQEVDELKLIPAFRPLADCKCSGTGAFPAVAMEAARYARAAFIPCGAGRLPKQPLPFLEYDDSRNSGIESQVHGRQSVSIQWHARLRRFVLRWPIACSVGWPWHPADRKFGRIPTRPPIIPSHIWSAVNLIKAAGSETSLPFML